MAIIYAQERGVDFFPGHWKKSGYKLDQLDGKGIAIQV